MYPAFKSLSKMMSQDQVAAVVIIAIISQKNKPIPTNISTSDQRCFNVVNQRWNDVDSTLKIKQNPMLDFPLYTTLIQRQCPALKQRRKNIAQRWYNVASTLFQPSVNVSSSYIEINQASDDYGFANRWIVFILLNEKTFLTIY